MRRRINRLEAGLDRLAEWDVMKGEAGPTTRRNSQRLSHRETHRLSLDSPHTAQLRLDRIHRRRRRRRLEVAAATKQKHGTASESSRRCGILEAQSKAV